MTATAAPAGSTIRLKDLGITFGSFEAVRGVSLDVPAGEFVCLLGPSGCGKSTVLSTIAGFEQSSHGEVTVDGSPIGGPDASRAVVFQSADALFPWMTAAENVAFGPRMRGAAKAEQQDLADEYLRLVGLSHARSKYPTEMSGGMRQRLQIARVLANKPRVVLMDEPFGALDAQTREVMQQEVDRIWRQTGCTIVFVTHDIGEAIRLADRVVTMTAGPRATLKHVYQVGLPHPRDDTHPDAVALHRALREDISTEVDATLRAQGIDDRSDPEAAA